MHTCHTGRYSGCTCIRSNRVGRPDQTRRELSRDADCPHLCTDGYTLPRTVSILYSKTSHLCMRDDDLFSRARHSPMRQSPPPLAKVVHISSVCVVQTTMECV
ncbi:hypothetical protein CBL_11399 [Carabus blaptoides fortunei]